MTIIKRLSKILQRTCCRSYASSSTDHQYANENSKKQQLSFWQQEPRTSDELLDFLTRNIIWENDDYVASVKPCGISGYGTKWGKLIEERIAKREGVVLERQDDSVTDDEDNEREQQLTVKSVLPELAFRLRCSELFLAKAVTRYYQGPLLMAKNDKAFRLSQNSLMRANAHRIFNITMICICIGKPKVPEGEDWCESHTEKINDEFTYTIHSGTITKSQIKRGDAKRGQFRYRVLASHADVSLIELKFIKMQHRLERLFLLQQGCPIIGDTLYQMQIAKVLGEHVLVAPKSAGLRNQVIPFDFMKRLGISLTDYHRLPMCAYVESIVFPALLRSRNSPRQDVELRSSFPAHVFSVLERLGWVDVLKQRELESEK